MELVQTPASSEALCLPVSRVQSLGGFLRRLFLPVILFAVVALSIASSDASTSALPTNPTVLDFHALAGFTEALVPTSTPTDADNAAFAAAVTAWLGRASTDDFSSLEDFVAGNTNSAWLMTALINLGAAQYHEGFFSKAIKSYTAAWNAGQSLTTPNGILLTDAAYASLLKLHVHLGHVAQTQALVSAAGNRVFTGKSPQVILRAQKPIADMNAVTNSYAFQCGPTAVGLVAAAMNLTNAVAVELAGHHAMSGTNGFSLEQIEEMSQQYGVPLQMAYRTKGAAVLFPSVMHSKLNHYSALSKTKNGRYFLQDTSLNDTFWLSKRAVDSESSGYFLVPTGSLPAGWRSVGAQEAANVWGSGNSANTDPTGPCPFSTGGCTGMPVASINLQQCSLLLNDTPVGYKAPVGPNIFFTIHFDQGDTTQPSTMNFPNFGIHASFPWLAYVDFDPSTPFTAVTLHCRGGGIEPYQYNESATNFFPGQYTGAILTQLSPTTFLRTMSDGSQEYYLEDDGSPTTGSDKKALLSYIVDPQGNTVTLGYTSNNNVATITDAAGQVSHLYYTDSTDPNKITQITDPFGRSAYFSYTNGLLSSATDVLGLTSTYNYNGGTINVFSGEGRNPPTLVGDFNRME